MAIFGKRILTKKRKQALDEFRKQAIKALERLSKDAKSELEKFLFEQMKKNVLSVPIYFYPGGTLRYALQRFGNKIGVSAIKGENVTLLKIIQIGGRRLIIRENFINLPADHIFAGDRLSLQGILTLCHEYAHFPKPMLGKFARSLNITPTQAEELLADMLAAKLAVALGFKKEQVLKHFAGREIVYGNFPYFAYIERAMAK